MPPRLSHGRIHGGGPTRPRFVPPLRRGATSDPSPCLDVPQARLRCRRPCAHFVGSPTALSGAASSQSLRGFFAAVVSPRPSRGLWPHRRWRLHLTSSPPQSPPTGATGASRCLQCRAFPVLIRKASLRPFHGLVHGGGPARHPVSGPSHLQDGRPPSFRWARSAGRRCEAAPSDAGRSERRFELDGDHRRLSWSVTSVDSNWSVTSKPSRSETTVDLNWSVTSVDLNKPNRSETTSIRIGPGAVRRVSPVPPVRSAGALLCAHQQKAATPSEGWAGRGEGARGACLDLDAQLATINK